MAVLPQSRAGAPDVSATPSVTAEDGGATSPRRWGRTFLKRTAFDPDVFVMSRSMDGPSRGRPSAAMDGYAPVLRGGVLVLAVLVPATAAALMALSLMSGAGGLLAWSVLG